ncbi:MAG: AlpA family transcriptional regulator [Caldimonas sp.]
MLIDQLVAPRAEPPTFLRLSAVVARTGLSRSTIYRFVRTATFPTPVKLGPRAIAWRRADVDKWSASRPATHFDHSDSLARTAHQVDGLPSS